MDRRPSATRASAALSADELAAVVRRATELDSALPLQESDLDVDEARLVLREAGISADAADQALAEWRTGDLGVPPPPLPVDAGGRLSPVVTVGRVVALEPPRVRQALETQLRRQWFAPGRDYGAAGAEWLPRAGLLADLRRRFDVRGTLLLDEVGRLRLDLAPGPPGSSRLRLTADLGGLRSRLLGSMVAVPAVAGAAVSLVGIPVESLELVASGLPLGLAVAGGGYLGASRTLERRRARVEESLQILLDRLPAR